jgi:hypothetical protein
MYIRKHAGPSTVRTLLVGLYDPDGAVRAAVCDALDALGDENIINALKKEGRTQAMMLSTARGVMLHCQRTQVRAAG